MSTSHLISYTPTLESPETRLAKLMSRELGASIDARTLSLFLRHHWTKVSCLAHKIHETDC